MIICTIDQKKLPTLLKSRESHLRYIAQNEKNISFAGIVETEADPYQQIVYFLDVNFEMAQSFIQNDPYFNCFEEVKLLPFSKKIPRS